METKVYEHIALDFFTPGHRNHEELSKGLLEEAKEVQEAEETGTRGDLLEELGDVLWYVTVMANQEGSSLSDLMMTNFLKLENRLLNGKK
jgi:NTP pyrophosphatase (non-canonical NTP hydrolase)